MKKSSKFATSSSRSMSSFRSVIPLAFLIVTLLISSLNYHHLQVKAATISNTANQNLNQNPNKNLITTFNVDKCLDCLCLASSLCDLNNNNKCLDKSQCGVYKLSFTYWADAGALTPTSNVSRFDDEDDFLSSSSIALLASPRDFEACATNSECARRSIRNYFVKYASDCNEDGRVDCLDMAAIHRAGSAACSARWLIDTDFWQNFLASGCVPGLPQRIFPPFQKLSIINSTPFKLQPPPSIWKSLDFTTNETIVTPSTITPMPITTTTTTTNNRRIDARSPQQQPPPRNHKLNVNTALDSLCFECLCNAQTNCDLSGANCARGSVCGPYAITSDYWLDAGSPGGDWRECSKTRTCSQTAVANYMARYVTDCDNDGAFTCQDVAAIHQFGASGCASANEPTVRAGNAFFTRFDRCWPRASSSASRSNTSLVEQPQPVRRPPTVNANSAELALEFPRPPSPPSPPTPPQPPQPPTFDIPTVQPDAGIPKPPPQNVLTLKPLVELASPVNPLTNNNNNGDNIADEVPKPPNGDALIPPLADLSSSLPSNNPNSPVDTPSISSSGNNGPVVDESFGETVIERRQPQIGGGQTDASQNSSPVGARPVRSNNPIVVDSSTSFEPTVTTNETVGSSSSSSLSNECFECICEASTSCNTNSRCQSSDVRHTRCGLFLISYDQWLEAGLSASLVTSEDLLRDPAADERAFYSCVTNRKCAEDVLTALAEKNSNIDCNSDKQFDCYDLAALHQVGRKSCGQPSLTESQYWSDFNACYGF